MFDFFHANENEQYLFLQLPWTLLKDDIFKKLSADSKILYSLLLNRTSLSIKNGWTDEQGRVYIVYTIEEIMDDLNCYEQKAVKCMKELKDIGLVRSKRLGQGKANITYVMNFATPLKYQATKTEPTNPEITQTCENHNSKDVKIAIPDLRKSQCSNKDLSNTHTVSKSMSKSKSYTGDELSTNLSTNLSTGLSTDLSTQPEANDIPKNSNEKEPIQTTPNSPESPSSTTPQKSPQKDHTTYLEAIQEQISYSDLVTMRPKDAQRIDEIVSCMLDVIYSNKETVRISGEDKNRELVKSQYYKLDWTDIEHILDKYSEQGHKIQRPKAYIQTMLYTCKQEISHHYDNEVRSSRMMWY